MRGIVNVHFYVMKQRNELGDVRYAVIERSDGQLFLCDWPDTVRTRYRFERTARRVAARWNKQRARSRYRASWKLTP